MILTCPSCRKSFRTDPGQFGNGPRAVACGACRYQWMADSSSLMTDQQFYQMRMGQLAAQQPAAPPSQPMPSPGFDPVPAAPAPDFPSDDLTPVATPDAEGDWAQAADDDALASEWQQDIADADAESADQLATGRIDEDEIPDELPSLVIDADEEPAGQQTKKKKRFGFLRKDVRDTAPDLQAQQRQEKPKKAPRRRAGWLVWVLWVLFLLLVSATVAGLYLFPAKVTAVWPPAGHLYEMLGKSVAEQPAERKPQKKGNVSTDKRPATAEMTGKKVEPKKSRPEKKGTDKSPPRQNASDENNVRSGEDPKNKVGLTLEVQIRSRRDGRAGKKDVMATIGLKNISQRARIVPPVVIKFIDVNGETVFERRVNLLTGPVSPGAEKHTNVQIKDVPASAMHLSATFDVPGTVTN